MVHSSSPFGVTALLGVSTEEWREDLVTEWDIRDLKPDRGTARGLEAPTRPIASG